MRSYFRNNPRPAGGGAQEGAKRPWWRRWLGGEGLTCAAKERDERYLHACADGDYRDTGYCVLHEPDEAKNKEAFEKVKQGKLDRKDYDFGGAVFPEGASNFRRRLFDADVTFAGATFHGKAAFSKAIFCGEANFCEATFKGEADFSAAKFRETGKEKAKEELKAREEAQEEAEKELEASKEALKKAREKEGRNAKGEAEEAKEAAEQVTRA
jgi:hypothetical protein